VTASTLSDEDIASYTWNEDRFTIDVALATGMGATVPLSTPPDSVKVLSAKCGALAIIRAIYSNKPPSQIDVKQLKGEVEEFLTKLEGGELIL
jgi:hypothetical protein